MSGVIKIEVELLMKFKKFLPADASGDKAEISMESGSTLADLKKKLGIPINEFTGIVLDRKHNEIEDTYQLGNKDKITFYSTVAGG